MAERIIPATPALAERERKAIEDMRSLFPDGNVSGLDSIDKPLGKRLSKLYVSLGYESRADMIEALGFRQENKGGGRSLSFKPDELLAELALRYEGVEKPSAVGILMFENPDLKGNIKTLQNKSTEIYGKSFSQVLVERGILGSTASRSTMISDDDIWAMVDKLEGIYAGVDKKVSSIAALKRLHPEYKAEFAAFTGRCEILYGKTPKKLLIEKGILAPSGNAVIDAEDEEINDAIHSLGEAICGLPEEKKPKTLTDLQKEYPLYKELIKAGKQKGLIDKELMQMLGILQPTKALLKRAGVRKAEAGSLAADYLSIADDAVITPDDASGLLPPYIAGIDVESKVELREMTIFVSGTCAKSMKAGDEFDAQPAKVSTEWGQEYWNLKVMSSPAYMFESAYTGGIFDQGEEGLAASPLDGFAKAKVLSVMDGLAKLRVRYVAPLRGETLAYVLRSMGYIDEDDVRGNMAWRFRLWKAQMDGVEPAPSVAPAKATAVEENAAEDANQTKAEQPESEEYPVEADVSVESSEEPETELAKKGEAVASAFGVGSSNKHTSDTRASFTFGVSSKGVKAENSGNKTIEMQEARAKREAEEIERKRIEDEEKRKAEEEVRKKAEEERLHEDAEEAERKRLEEERRKAEDAKNKAEYERGVTEMAKGTEIGYKSAEKIFIGLSEYSDAQSKAQECRKRIEAMQEKERLKKEKEARAKAEEERQKKIEAQKVKISELEKKLAAVQTELAAFDRRAEEIGALETKAKGIENYISGLGLFKGKEKRLKQQELSQVMARIADLKKQNIGMVDKQRAVISAQRDVDKANAELKGL